MRRLHCLKATVLLALLAVIAVLTACSGDEDGADLKGAGAPQAVAGGGAPAKTGDAKSKNPEPENAGIEGDSPSPPSVASMSPNSADLDAIRANLGDPSTKPAPVPATSPEPLRPGKPEVSLTHMLDRVWGIRLPGSTSGHALEARIGPPPYTLSFAGAVDADLPELFARELVVVVSKKEMIVNDVKVADVIERQTGEDGATTWEVPKAEGSFRIRGLTAQLKQYLGYRSTLLRATGLSPELADGCDLATLILDEELPYRFLSEVVLSAGHADLFRFRLATRSHDGLVSYQIITAPRLDPRLVDATHLIGDAWWQEPPPQSSDFEFAYVNYIATSKPDAWMGECEQDLGVCIPPAVGSWDDLTERSLQAELETTLEQIRARSRAAACSVDSGDVEPTVAENRGMGAPPTEPSSADSVGQDEQPERTPVSAAKAAEAKTVDVEIEPEPVPAGTLVVTSERPGTRVPFIYLRQDGAYLVLFDMERLEAVRSELFGPEKLDLMVETLKESHPGPGVLHIGADLDVPIARLVEVADLLRHRCRIQSMSGRCIERERWLASVVLFASPAGRFSLVPEPPPAGPGDPEPYHPSIDAPLPSAGLCPLKEVQEATASRLEAMQVCLDDLDPRPDVTLSFRWHVAGRLDLVATDPPLPGERVRCLKATLSELAASREVACDAALLLKAHPDSTDSTGSTG